MLTFFILTSKSMRWHHYFHFTVEETEAQSLAQRHTNGKRLKVTRAKTRMVGRIAGGVGVKLEGPRKPCTPADQEGPSQPTLPALTRARPGLGLKSVKGQDGLESVRKYIHF